LEWCSNRGVISGIIGSWTVAQIIIESSWPSAGTSRHGWC